MNSVNLVGRLCADPELKVTQSGKNYTRFRLAVDRSYVKSGEERQSDFFSIIAWNKTAEFVSKYFSKGDRIGITGTLRADNYTAQDGTKRESVEVWVDNAEFVDSNKKTNNQSDSAKNISKPQNTNQEDLNIIVDNVDNDLPF